jgi:hypothetical protein
VGFLEISNNKIDNNTLISYFRIKFAVYTLGALTWVPFYRAKHFLIFQWVSISFVSWVISSSQPQEIE